MSVKEKYGLTDEGVRNIRCGVIWTVVTNFVIFAGAGMLLMATAQLVAMLAENAAAPDPVFYLAGVAVFAIVLFIAQKNQYHSEYTTIYDESARRRISLAERLRKLPLSFFGQRDVADLTEVMMSDVATCEHAFSDALPQLYGATITLGIAAVGLFALDWRLAAAALWSAPVAFFLLFALRGMMRPLVEAKREADLRVSDDMQEALECVREVRATNQASRFLEPIHEHLDSAERANMRGELLSGVLVNGAQVVLRLGIATTVLAGASLIAAGETGFFMFLLFLIVVSRIYAPFDQCLNYVAKIFAAQTSAARMKAFCDEPLAEGAEAFEPCGYDVAFEDVGFSYGEGGPKVLDGVTFAA
ncbi:ABC transporter ATP-binding protein, partial [Slackia piriformis]|nr:ABC transporter ATP-binding protein [Slackia piriformis]